MALSHCQTPPPLTRPSLGVLQGEVRGFDAPLLQIDGDVAARVQRRAHGRGAAGLQTQRIWPGSANHATAERSA